MNSKIIKALLATILLQGMVLIGMVVKAALPLWTGTEIRVKTLPVDPRSLFRGNYAQLNYDFSTIPYKEVTRDMPLRNGEVVYVTLRQNENGLYEYAALVLEEPQAGIFLRGRVEQGRYANARSPLRIKYGIEAYFAPKERALVLEKKLRDGGVAVLMVGRDGRGRIKGVVGE